MKIYLDNCALGRLFDDQTQPRVRAEALAMRSVLDILDRGNVRWISSTALEAEVSHNSDLLRRLDIEVLLLRAHLILRATTAVQRRTAHLQSIGFRGFDAEHVAFAEHSKVDALLTTDDRLIKRYRRLRDQDRVTSPPAVDILNPVDWLRKVER